MVFLTPFWKEIWNHLAQTSNHYNFRFTEPILIIFFSKNSYEFSASRRLLKSTILELSFLTLICLQIVWNTLCPYRNIVWIPYKGACTEKKSRGPCVRRWLRIPKCGGTTKTKNEMPISWNNVQISFKKLRNWIFQEHNFLHQILHFGKSLNSLKNLANSLKNLAESTKFREKSCNLSIFHEMSIPSFVRGALVAEKKTDGDFFSRCRHPNR